MFGWGPPEMIIVGVIAVVLFGNRLPSVARSMGKSFTEFKKGMQGMQDEMRDAMNTDSVGSLDHEEESWSDTQAPTAKAFEPPKAE